MLVNLICNLLLFLCGVVAVAFGGVALIIIAKIILWEDEE